MKFKTRAIKNLCESSTNRETGCDYLTLSYQGKLEFFERLKHLDGDNSNHIIIYGTDGTYTIEKNYHKGEPNYHIFYTNDTGDISYSIPIMKVTNFTSANKVIKTDVVVNIYGGVFRLIKMGIFESLDGLLHDIFQAHDFTLLQDSKITRIDRCIDLMFKQDTKAPNHKSLINFRKGTQHDQYSLPKEEAQKYSQIKNHFEKTTNLELLRKEHFITIKQREEHEQITGRVIGKRTTHNQTCIVRMYDKQLDCITKSKCSLYQDYFQYKSVYRIEAQLGTRFLRSKNTFYTLNNLEDVFTKCQSFFGLEKKNYGNYFYNPDMNINYKSVAYISNYVNRGAKILKQGLNPIEYQINRLIDGGVYSKQLIKNLLSSASKIVDENNVPNFYNSPLLLCGGNISQNTGLY